jgi:flagellar hook-associated protein 1 FlgK
VSTDAAAARESGSGVNTDEEMVNLLTYQRAYEAASRVITSIDDTLDTLINRTGMVGR